MRSFKIDLMGSETSVFNDFCSSNNEREQTEQTEQSRENVESAACDK